MLTPEQIALIQQEVDGANSPADQAACRELLARDPDAWALATELTALAAQLSAAGERAPPPGLRHAILERYATQSRASPAAAPHRSGLAALVQSVVSQLKSIPTLLEETMAKKALIIGTTAVAVIAIIGYSIGGYPPSGSEIGTIGAGDEISGVQRASRYRGRTMNESDVSLTNPDIQLIFQNHEVLTLVKSDVFREAMNNDAFRELQSNEAFRELMRGDAFRELMKGEAFRELMNNEAFRELANSEAFRDLAKSEAFRELASSEAFRELQSSDAFRELANNEAFRELQKSEAFRELANNDAFRAAMNNEAFRDAMSMDAFREAMSNDAFREAMSNDAFREVMSNDAFRELQKNDAFRELSRNAQLSEVFMNLAMRSQQ